MTRNKIDVKHHADRNDLIGEHSFGDAGQAIIACLFAVIWIIDTFFLHYTTFLNSYVSNIIRIPLAVVLLVLSVYMARTGMAIVFGEKRDKPSIIRKSIFNIIRHPIYLSEILLYLGLLLISISLAAVFVLIIGIIFLHYISRSEEKLLLAYFGEDYKKYMQEVPMWFPRLGKRREKQL